MVALVDCELHALNIQLIQTSQNEDRNVFFFFQVIVGERTKDRALLSKVNFCICSMSVKCGEENYKFGKYGLTITENRIQQEMNHRSTSA